MQDIHKAFIVIFALVVSNVAMYYHFQNSIHQYVDAVHQNLILIDNQRTDFQGLMDATRGACTDSTCVSNPVNCLAFIIKDNVTQCQITEQATKAGY